MNEISELQCKSGLLGVYQDFQYEEKKSKLKNGDTLMLYTDGVFRCYE